MAASIAPNASSRRSPPSRICWRRWEVTFDRALVRELRHELGITLRRVVLGETLGEQLVESQPLGVATEQDVDAAPRHVGRDGDAVGPAGLRHDVRLTFVLLRVEDRVV